MRVIDLLAARPDIPDEEAAEASCGMVSEVDAEPGPAPDRRA